jgi:hypothetical protein
VEENEMLKPIIAKIAFLSYFAQSNRSAKKQGKIVFSLAKSYSYMFLRKAKKQLVLYCT